MTTQKCLVEGLIHRKINFSTEMRVPVIYKDNEGQKFINEYFKQLSKD